MNTVEETLSVARKFYKKYAKCYNRNMSEMKMHKLMYFVQRESLMYYNTPLFGEPFLGWKYGPVLLSIRKEYKKRNPFARIDKDISQESTKLVDNVFSRYGSISPWKLSALSHNEFSWKKARIGLNSEDNGKKELSLQAMKIDAIRELSERNESDKP